jgi:hypothetical protein
MTARVLRLVGDLSLIGVGHLFLKLLLSVLGLQLTDDVFNRSVCEGISLSADLFFGLLTYHRELLSKHQ